MKARRQRQRNQWDQNTISYTMLIAVSNDMQNYIDTCSIDNNIEDMNGIQNGLRFSILWSVYCFPKPTITIGSNNIS